MQLPRVCVRGATVQQCLIFDLSARNSLWSGSGRCYNTVSAATLMHISGRVSDRAEKPRVLETGSATLFVCLVRVLGCRLEWKPVSGLWSPAFVEDRYRDKGAQSTAEKQVSSDGVTGKVSSSFVANLIQSGRKHTSTHTHTHNRSDRPFFGRKELTNGSKD